MRILRWMMPLALALAGVLPAGMAGGQEFPVGSTPAAFAALIQADLEAKRKPIAAAGIEAE